MTNYNLHTHSDFCHGTSPAEDYIKQAISIGMDIIGISCHAPIPFDITLSDYSELNSYYDGISHLKNKYGDSIKILLGLEVDYIPGLSSANLPIYSCLDYTVGSVHFLDLVTETDIVCIDRTEDLFRRGLSEQYDNKIQSMVSRYYSLIREMVAVSPPNIIGHLDKIKRFNIGGRYFSEDDDWYKQEVLRTLETIRSSESIVEVNTAGLYKSSKQFLCPSTWVLEKILDMNIPIMVNSDAHNPDDLEKGFCTAYSMLRTLGFSHEYVCMDGQKEALALV